MTAVSGRYKSFKTLLRRGSMRFLRILQGISRRTHLKYLLNMPDSIKVALVLSNCAPEIYCLPGTQANQSQMTAVSSVCSNSQSSNANDALPKQP